MFFKHSNNIEAWLVFNHLKYKAREKESGEELI
jgi:hypothetical protein